MECEGFVVWTGQGHDVEMEWDMKWKKRKEMENVNCTNMAVPNLPHMSNLTEIW